MPSPARPSPTQAIPGKKEVSNAEVSCSYRRNRRRVRRGAHGPGRLRMGRERTTSRIPKIRGVDAACCGHEGVVPAREANTGPTASLSDDEKFEALMTAFEEAMTADETLADFEREAEVHLMNFIRRLGPPAISDAAEGADHGAPRGSGRGASGSRSRMINRRGRPGRELLASLAGRRPPVALGIPADLRRRRRVQHRRRASSRTYRSTTLIARARRRCSTDPR